MSLPATHDPGPCGSMCLPRSLTIRDVAYREGIRVVWPPVVVCSNQWGGIYLMTEEGNVLYGYAWWMGRRDVLYKAERV